MEPYDKGLKPYSRQLRRNMTDAEQHLWRFLRRKQIHGVPFNRQKPILSYIVDFYCAQAKMVVEIDGSQHGETAHRHKDQLRDEALSELGLLVLRFDNTQVLTQVDDVLAVIYRTVGERINPP